MTRLLRPALYGVITFALIGMAGPPTLFWKLDGACRFQPRTGLAEAFGLHPYGSRAEAVQRACWASRGGYAVDPGALVIVKRFPR